MIFPAIGKTFNGNKARIFKNGSYSKIRWELKRNNFNITKSEYDIIISNTNTCIICTTGEMEIYKQTIDIKTFVMYLKTKICTHCKSRYTFALPGHSTFMLKYLDSFNPLPPSHESSTHIEVYYKKNHQYTCIFCALARKMRHIPISINFFKCKSEKICNSCNLQRISFPLSSNSLKFTFNTCRNKLKCK